jgi:hypothetical protein
MNKRHDTINQLVLRERKQHHALYRIYKYCRRIRDTAIWEEPPTSLNAEYIKGQAWVAANIVETLRPLMEKKKNE